jgi:hypothetical protein
VCQPSIPNCQGNSAATDSALFPNGAFVELNTSGNTWVCADNGASASVWANLDQQPVVGRTYCFPVVDQTQTVLTQTGAPLAYDVKGFAALKVIGENKQGNTFFLTLEWGGATACGTGVIGPPGTGLGANAIQLSE